MSDNSSEQVETMAKESVFKLPKSAIRRLAHDAKAKMSKDTHQIISEEVKLFLARVLSNSAKAAKLANKKRISYPHISFGIDCMHIKLPPELRFAETLDLRKLKKCNYKAPPTQRKANLLHVEIPSSTFRRSLKYIDFDTQCLTLCPKTLNIKAANYLQLITEQWILQYFFDKRKNELFETSSKDLLNLRSLDFILKCTRSEAESLVRFLNQLFDCIASLLVACVSKTIDQETIKIASVSLLPELATYQLVQKNNLLNKYCERMLKGRIIDVRIMKNSYIELSSILQIIVENKLLFELLP